MKRSEVNAIIRDGDAFLVSHQFFLPPFAYWTPSQWAAAGDGAGEIVERRLGWDITDFGQGDYARVGLFVFTIRNGNPEDLALGRGKLYAEKVLIVDPNQVTPFHFHWVKTEDIINRGGGQLVVQVHNSTDEGGLDDSDVTVKCDGVGRTVAAGETVTLRAGESITLPPGLYHQFWGRHERVLVGEVSLVNDDHTDNRFLDAAGRFPTIEEDEEPLHLLVGDYDRWVPRST